MPLSTSLRLRAGATFAAAATAAALVPMFAAGPASAAGTCVAPSSLAPDDGPAAIAPDRKELVLTWKGVPGAAGYQVQISPNEDFTSNLEVDAATVATTYVPDVLLPHLSYFWRVRALGASCWSDDAGQAAEFTRGWVPAAVPQLPGDGAQVQVSDLQFSWGEVRHASQYLLQITGAAKGSCYVDGTSYTPYSIGGDPGLTPERMGSDSDCGLGARLPLGDYSWQVTPLDGTNVTVNDDPYKESNVNPDPTPAEPVNGSKSATVVADAEAGFPVAGGDFTLVADSSDLGPDLGAPVAYAVDPNNQVVDCSTVCSTTPTIAWTPVTGATKYSVIIAEDKYFLHTIREYDTAFDSLTPRDLLLDAQAGRAYYYAITSDTGASTETYTFRVRNSVVTGLSSTMTGRDVTLSWTDPVDSKSLTEAAMFDVQVATDCGFTDPVVEDAKTDLPQYTSKDISYAPGTYYWRVKSIFQNGASGPWSVGNKDVAQCASGAASFVVPAAGNNVPTPGTAVSGPVKVDSTAKAVVRTGAWSTARSSMAYLKNLLVTSGAAHQKLAFTFNNGASIKVSYCSGPLNGVFTVYVDGKAKKTINGYKRFVKCGLSYIAGGLDKTKNHTISVVATGKAGHSPKGGKRLSIDFFQVV